MDSVSEALLSLVNPLLADKIRLLAEMMDLTGEPIRVEQGLRSWSKQAEIYAQGRTAPGEIVTNAPPGHSWHEFGLAVDVCPLSLLPTVNWTPESPIWTDMGSKGKSLGLFWGGDFSHPDRPHFQLTGTFPVSPDDETRQVFKDGGMLSVWEEAGLGVPVTPAIKDGPANG